jgi:hypothetical protein
MTLEVHPLPIFLIVIKHKRDKNGIGGIMGLTILGRTDFSFEAEIEKILPLPPVYSGYTIVVVLNNGQRLSLFAGPSRIHSHIPVELIGARVRMTAVCNGAVSGCYKKLKEKVYLIEQKGSPINSTGIPNSFTGNFAKLIGEIKTAKDGYYLDCGVARFKMIGYAKDLKTGEFLVIREFGNRLSVTGLEILSKHALPTKNPESARLYPKLNWKLNTGIIDGMDLDERMKHATESKCLNDSNIRVELDGKKIKCYQEIALHGMMVYKQSKNPWTIALSFHSPRFEKLAHPSYVVSQADPDSLLARLEGRVASIQQTNSPWDQILLDCGGIFFRGKIMRSEDISVGDFVAIPEDLNIIEAELVDVQFPAGITFNEMEFFMDVATYMENVWFKARVIDVKTNEETDWEGAVDLELRNGERLHLYTPNRGMKKDIIGREIRVKAGIFTGGELKNFKCLDVQEKRIVCMQNDSKIITTGEVITDNIGNVYLDCGVAVFGIQFSPQIKPGMYYSFENPSLQLNNYYIQ